MFSKMQIHLFDMDNYLKLLSCRLTELHEAVDKPKSCYDIQGVSPAITVGNKMDTIIWILCLNPAVSVKQGITSKL